MAFCLANMQAAANNHAYMTMLVHSLQITTKGWAEDWGIEVCEATCFSEPSNACYEVVGAPCSEADNPIQ